MSIELKNIGFTYGQGTAFEHCALKNINLKIEKNNRGEDYKIDLLLIILNTSLLYIVARKNYELQKNLQR